ncbi:glycosyl hydrolase family 8 [Companilactobacillus kimchiensis]|uniref:Glucanase n=1 Tax=Companilactobacillus kimchiensis TaxID=993692 RepID=A0A0R2LQX8_9LACO|nr:glycosyl hydrolase family 8 [Companilactobacillus kimchiensis]KRO00762.1 endoglucanase Y [Companilactobacillus kimchiensis]
MFKKHKYQWLIGGLIILVALAIGTAIYSTTQSTQNTSSVDESTIKSHYQTWEKSYLITNHQQNFIKTNDSGNLKTLSESQGYGMLITVMAAKQGFGSQKTFDKLTRYYLAHQIDSSNPLMAWRQQQKNGKMISTKAEKTSATDGDLDIAYALILADEQWGSKGDLKYNNLAKQLLSAIQKREINPTTKLPKVGDWSTSASTVDLVRTSDLMTAYFRKFASYTQDGSWSKVAQNSQTVLKKLSDQQSTGLMADFVTVSGTQLKTGSVKAKQVASEYDNQYGFNACRIPWRVAYDYQLNHSQISKSIVQKMNRFFVTRRKITAVYTLNGKAVESYTNVAFTAPVAYAAEVLSNQTLKTRYTSSLTSKMSTNNYYPATIQMLTLLASGSLGESQK